MMERFNYANLAAVKAESAEIYYLLECESYGRVRDEEEKLAEQEADIESQREEMSHG